MVQASQLEGDSQLDLPSDVTLKTVLPAPRLCCVQSPLFSVAPPPKARPWRSLSDGLVWWRWGLEPFRQKGGGLSESPPLPAASCFTAAWIRAPSAWRPAGAQACSPCSACDTAPSTCWPACRMAPSPRTLGPAVRMWCWGFWELPWAPTKSQIQHQRSCGRQTKEAAQQSPGIKVLERLEVPHPHRGPQRDGALPVVWTAQPIGRRLCCIGSESLGSERPGFTSGLCPDDCSVRGEQPLLRASVSSSVKRR